MSNANGRIYIDTSVTPNKGIDVSRDVAHVLGRSTRQFGQLCGDVDKNGVRVNAINMWSLQKPVRRAGGSQPSNWQAASSGNYGINPHGFGAGATALTALRTYAYDGKLNGWEYEPPRGLDHNEGFRVRDFNEYYHYSQRPFDGWSGMATSIVGGNVWFGLDNVVNDWAGIPGSIYYEHLKLTAGSTSKYLKDCYFGVAVFNSANNCIGIITCQNKMGAAQPEYFEDANWSCGFDNIDWPAGTYQVFPFFWISDTDAPMPSGWTSLQYGEIYSIPYTAPKQVVVRNAVTSVVLGGACGIDSEYSSTILIGFGPTLTVEGSGSYTLNQVQVLLSASGGSGSAIIYDTDNDAGYFPVSVSSGGSPYQLVDAPDGSTQGITNCPPQVEKPKLPGSGTYTATVIAVLTPDSGGNPITIQKNYEIS